TLLKVTGSGPTRDFGMSVVDVGRLPGKSANAIAIGSPGCDGIGCSMSGAECPVHGYVEIVGIHDGRRLLRFTSDEGHDEFGESMARLDEPRAPSPVIAVTAPRSGARPLRIVDPGSGTTLWYTNDPVLQHAPLAICGAADVDGDGADDLAVGIYDSGLSM